MHPNHEGLRAPRTRPFRRSIESQTAQSARGGPAGGYLPPPRPLPHSAPCRIAKGALGAVLEQCHAIRSQQHHPQPAQLHAGGWQGEAGRSRHPSRLGRRGSAAACRDLPRGAPSVPAGCEVAHRTERTVLVEDSCDGNAAGGPFNVAMPQKWASIRRLPPKSLQTARRHARRNRSRLSSAAPPGDLPAATRLSVRPWSSLLVTPPEPPRGQFVLPSRMAPDERIRATTVASRAGLLSASSTMPERRRQR